MPDRLGPVVISSMTDSPIVYSAAEVVERCSQHPAWLFRPGRTEGSEKHLLLVFLWGQFIFLFVPDPDILSVVTISAMLAESRTT